MTNQFHSLELHQHTAVSYIYRQYIQHSNDKDNTKYKARSFQTVLNEET